MESNRTKTRRNFLKAAGAAAGLAGLNGLPFAVRIAHAAGEKKMKIGVIGSGRIGGTLGGVWVKAGHEVMFSSRTPENDRKLAASLGPNARAGTPRARPLGAIRGGCLEVLPRGQDPRSALTTS